MKKAIVILNPGFEELEAITPIDYLRRAGLSVTVLSTTDQLALKGRSGVVVLADELLVNHQGLADVLVIPGGPGSKTINDRAETRDLILAHAAAGATMAAICAAPAVVLAPLGLLKGRRFTCFPGSEQSVQEAQFSTDRVVIDANYITSRSAGTAGEFAAAIVAQVLGEAAAERLRAEVLLPE